MGLILGLFFFLLIIIFFFIIIFSIFIFNFYFDLVWANLTYLLNNFNLVCIRLLYLLLWVELLELRLSFHYLWGSVIFAAVVPIITIIYRIFIFVFVSKAL